MLRWCLPEHRRLHGVAIPPVRLRLDLGVQVDQVLTELLRVGCEVGAVRTRFAFWHLRLLSEAARRMVLGRPLTQEAPNGTVALVMGPDLWSAPRRLRIRWRLDASSSEHMAGWWRDLGGCFGA
jgi:hypothetical protein